MRDAQSSGNLVVRMISRPEKLAKANGVWPKVPTWRGSGV